MFNLPGYPAEETTAEEQKKIEEAAARELAVLKQHLAQMSHQIVPDVAILSMSPAGLLLALSKLFNVTEEDILDHPQFRELEDIDPVAYPDYIRHALVTTLYEQGVQFSLTMMKWLQPLSVTVCRAYDAATLWGNSPEHEFKIAASRVYFCSRTTCKHLDFVLSAFLRCRLEVAAVLPSGHPDLEAARRAVLGEVKLSGIPVANDWSQQYEEEEEEEEFEVEPGPMTLEQATAQWNQLPAHNPLGALPLSRRDREAKTTRASLEFNVTSFDASDPRELLARVDRLNRNILTEQTDSAAECKFPHKTVSEFYSANQMKTYNEKMNSCRTLEKIILSHSEPSSALRDELGSLQWQIAQEGAALW